MPTGEAANAYNLLNNERSSCGFGLLAQNTSLDASASAQAAYLVANNNNAGGSAHIEVAGSPGFVGVNPVDRITAKGYPGTVFTTSEVAAVGTGVVAIRILLSGPYHEAALLRSFRDVGMGFQTAALANFAKYAHPPKIGHFVKFNASEGTWTPNGSLVAALQPTRIYASTSSPCF